MKRKLLKILINRENRRLIEEALEYENYQGSSVPNHYPSRRSYSLIGHINLSNDEQFEISLNQV